MIETDNRGQEQIKELLHSRDSFDWNDWELNFIEGLTTRTYASLSTKQKAVISTLMDKLLK